jgi:short-subunit dehydrogenase
MADRQAQQSAAVVTGATSGIGRVIALHLARQGIWVAGIGRNAAALAELEAKASDLSG